MTERVYRLQCQCGQLQGNVTGLTPGGTVRVTCHCRYCAKYLRHLGQPLQANTGVDLFITMPDHLSIERGQEHLRCLRLSRKGPLRFYAGCCNTPLASCLADMRIPFASVSRQCIPEFSEDTVFARATAREPFQVHLPPSADIEALFQEKAERTRLVSRVIWLVFKGMMRGAGRKSPFRGRDGEPAAVVYPIRLS